MPVDLEMLLSTSPSLFTHSTISDCRYSNCAVQSRNFLNSHRKETDHQPFVYHAVTNYFQDHLLGHKQDSDNAWSKQNVPEDTVHPQSKTEKKKKVSFADDKGLSLVDIRVITEVPDYNPPWTDDFLSILTCGVKPNVTSEKKWKPTFDLPPYDPIVFSSKIERDMVSLERAVLQEDNEDLLTGLIKVKNIAFEKEVFVRVTFDRWMTNKDIPAKFVQESSGLTRGLEASGGLDTFEFSVEIPSSATRYQVVEFCLCYRCSGKEYWDNNGGINYRLVTANSMYRNSAVSQNLANGRRHSTIESPTWASTGYRW